MDELRLQSVRNNCVKNVCVLLITKTWLQHSVPDSAIALECDTTQHYDQTADSSKGRGGLYVYINNS